MLDIRRQRSSWDGAWAPVGYGEVNQENFDTWWGRNEERLRNLHPQVAEQWSYLLACALLAGCASDLSGTWRVQWLDGREETVLVQDFSDGRWNVKGTAPELNGVYTLKGSEFVCVQPELPAMAGFAWNRTSKNLFTLIQQPEATRLHDHWLGAQMHRVTSGTHN
jgi:hypothetical protein